MKVNFKFKTWRDLKKATVATRVLPEPVSPVLELLGTTSCKPCMGRLCAENVHQNGEPSHRVVCAGSGLNARVPVPGIALRTRTRLLARCL